MTVLRPLLARVRRVRSSTLLVFLIAGIAACSGQSCSCITPIPGGFPAANQRLNGVQTRFTSSFMSYVSANAPQIVPNVLPTTVSIPPSCTGSNKICCGTPQPTCDLSIDATSLVLTPSAPNQLHFAADLVVKSLQIIPVDTSVGSCNVSIDTTRKGDQYLTATGDVTFPVDGTTHLTQLTLANGTVDDIDDGDVNLDESGSDFACSVGNLGIIKGFIIDYVAGQVGGLVSNVVKGEMCQSCSTVADCPSTATACTMSQCIGADGVSCIQQLGIQGRADVGSFLASFSPDTRASIDIMEVAGGYANADTGLSLGILGGAKADPHSSCVPVVAAPPPTDIGPSVSFAGDVVPGTTTAYDVGVGVHVSHLSQLGYSFWDAGGLCLGIGSAQVSALSAMTLSLIMPSLADLLHADDAPVLLQLRPQAPPTFTLGKGTFKTSGANMVVDDPLVTVNVPSLVADFYLFVDDRYVRLATLTTDLALPLGLETDATGGLVLVPGSLTSAFTNVHVTNSELVAETKAELEAAFPALLSVSIGSLFGKIPALHLPSLAGLSLAPKVITSVEPDSNGVLQFLALFSDVMSASAAHLAVPTSAQLVSVQTPPTSVFAIDKRNGEVPSITVAVQGDARPLEWSYAFDHGAWHPFQRAASLTITDDLLWLQGRHTVALRGRAVGEPASLDPTPVELSFIIDSQAPTGSFSVENGQIVAHATDRISEALEYRVGGGAFGKSAQLGVAPSAPAQLTVEARDEAGNVTRLPFHGTTPTSGCDIGRAPGSHGTKACPLALLVIALLLLQRRRVLVAALLLVGCHHGGASTGDQLDPANQLGRTHDLRVQGTSLHLSAYDQTTGDLAYASVATSALSSAIEWTVVDGVDESSPVDKTVKYRGGHTAPGPDVGYYSALAVTDKGAPRIAYFDATNHALKFASGPFPFESHTVDAGTADGTIEVGTYPAILLDVSGAPIVVYAAVGMGDATSGFTSELRLAYAKSSTPRSAADWTISTIESTAIGCGGRCPTGNACIVDAMVNGMPNTDPVLSSCVPIDIAPCAIACTAGTACIAGVCTDEVPAHEVGALPEGTGLFTKLVDNGSGTKAIAYYDASHHRLRVATQSGAKTFLPQTVDGDIPGTDYGQHVSAAYGADGTLHLAYVDAVASTLVYRSLDSGLAPSARAIVDDGTRADGTHPVGASASLLVNGSALTILYQDQATSDLELATGPAWSHVDFQAGAPGYGFSSHQVAGTGATYFSSYVVDRSAMPLGHIELGTLP